MCIVSIPLPLLWTVKLSIKRKLAIGVLLCSGVFVMIAALLRCILSLKDIDGINVSTIWAIRETVSNIYPLEPRKVLTFCSLPVCWHYRRERSLHKTSLLFGSLAQLEQGQQQRGHQVHRIR